MKCTRASILCLDTEVAEPLNETVVLAGTFKDENAILKAARPLIERGSVKAVSVAASQVEENLYRMTETYFIEHAEKIEK